jgi:hypothetical protein
MSGFDDVTISWAGTDYVVPANRMMMLVCKLEDALAGDAGEDAMTVLLHKQPRARIAHAYEVALIYAGADLEPGEVYLSVMESLSEKNIDHARLVSEAVMTLLALVAPPVHAKLSGNARGSTGKKQTAD